jgi:hypothetical protein
MATDVKDVLPSTFPEDAVRAALDKWWADEIADAELPGDGPIVPDIMKPAVEIDSHRAVRALVTLEEILKFSIPESVIKEGGYDDFSEMKAHILPKLNEVFEKKRKKEYA